MTRMAMRIALALSFLTLSVVVQYIAGLPFVAERHPFYGQPDKHLNKIQENFMNACRSTLSKPGTN